MIYQVEKSLAVAHCCYFIDGLLGTSGNSGPSMYFAPRNVCIGKEEQSRGEKAQGAPPWLTVEMAGYRACELSIFTSVLLGFCNLTQFG